MGATAVPRRPRGFALASPPRAGGVQSDLGLLRYIVDHADLVDLPRNAIERDHAAPGTRWLLVPMTVDAFDQLAAFEAEHADHEDGHDEEPDDEEQEFTLTEGIDQEERLLLASDVGCCWVGGMAVGLEHVDDAELTLPEHIEKQG